ncbi:MAG: glycosyltransferase [Armatimonadetes bacterium]|nr:glycosyltransferase [Armatimonadota bacterium]MDW8122467.1 glycosyltransferase [Armatimonadota bacterium]
MRVAIVTSWQVPCGIANYSKELVGALQRQCGLAVTIVPVGPQVWQTHGLTTGLFRDRVYLRHAATQAARASLVHIQFAPVFFGGLKPFRNWLPFFLTRCQRPAVVTVHELDSAGPLPIRWLKLWEQRRIFRAPFVRHLIAPYRLAAETIGRLSKRPVTVLPLWVPSDERPLDTLVAKEKLGLSGRFVLLAFGFVVKRRGYEVLIRALEKLSSDILLILAGGAHPLDRSGYYDQLIRWIQSRPIRQRVRLLGYVPDEQVPLIMSAADVVVAPFLSLTGSASLMKALAYGKPIVASDLPFVRDLADHSGAVLTVPPADPEKLAQALQKLRDDPDRLQQLAQSANDYRQINTVQKAAEAHRAIYEGCLL